VITYGVAQIVDLSWIQGPENTLSVRWLVENGDGAKLSIGLMNDELNSYNNLNDQGIIEIGKKVPGAIYQAVLMGTAGDSPVSKTIYLKIPNLISFEFEQTDEDLAIGYEFNSSASYLSTNLRVEGGVQLSEVSQELTRTVDLGAKIAGATYTAVLDGIAQTSSADGYGNYVFDPIRIFFVPGLAEFGFIERSDNTLSLYYKLDQSVTQNINLAGTPGLFEPEPTDDACELPEPAEDLDGDLEDPDSGIEPDLDSEIDDADDLADDVDSTEEIDPCAENEDSDLETDPKEPIDQDLSDELVQSSNGEVTPTFVTASDDELASCVRPSEICTNIFASFDQPEGVIDLGLKEPGKTYFGHLDGTATSSAEGGFGRMHFDETISITIPELTYFEFEQTGTELNLVYQFDKSEATDLSLAVNSPIEQAFAHSAVSMTQNFGKIVQGSTYTGQLKGVAVWDAAQDRGKYFYDQSISVDVPGLDKFYFVKDTETGDFSLTYDMVNTEEEAAVVYIEGEKLQGFLVESHPRLILVDPYDPEITYYARVSGTATSDDGIEVDYTRTIKASNPQITNAQIVREGDELFFTYEVIEADWVNLDVLVEGPYEEAFPEIRTMTETLLIGPAQVGKYKANLTGIGFGGLGQYHFEPIARTYTIHPDEVTSEKPFDAPVESSDYESVTTFSNAEETASSSSASKASSQSKAKAKSTPKADHSNYLAWDDEYQPQVIVRYGPLRGGIYAISNGLGANSGAGGLFSWLFLDYWFLWALLLGGLLGSGWWWFIIWRRREDSQPSAG
jgi:hypothetical protein